MTTRDDTVGQALAVLGDAVFAPEGWDATRLHSMLSAAEREGLGPLLAQWHAGSRSSIEARERLTAVTSSAVAGDVIRTAALIELLAAFRHAAVDVLLFKGEQLARTCYERPDLRPRLDSDVLVRRADPERARDVLRASSYAIVPQLEADLISHQSTFTRRLAGGVEHVIDLHWRVTNPEAFGLVFDVDELFEAATQIQGLPTGVRGPCAAHAMLLALVHPAAHHFGNQRVIWELDVALLAFSLTASDWDTVASLAISRGVAAIVLEQLRRVTDRLGTQVPQEVMRRLQQGTGHGAAIRRPVSLAAAFFDNLRAFPRWRDRAKALRQHLLPSASYMRSNYAPASRIPLPALYVHRVATGAWKYCRRLPR